METAKIDVQRCYAVRCPSCCRYMNVAGSSLAKYELIKCWSCKAKSRARNWINKTEYMNAELRSN